MEYTFTFSSVSWSTNTGEDFLAALWGNMLTTTVNTQGTYLLCWIQWRNLFFCIQPPAKGVRENMFLRLLNWSETSKIPYLWLKHCLKLCKPSERLGFLFSDTPPHPRKQNHRNPILIPINPSWDTGSHCPAKTPDGTFLEPWSQQDQEPQDKCLLLIGPIQVGYLVILAP